MIPKASLVVASLAFAVSACSVSAPSISQAPPAAPVEVVMGRDADAPGLAGATPAFFEPEVAANDGSAQAPSDDSRIVIRTGSLALVVTDPKVTSQQVSALATRLGGYVVSATTSHYFVQDPPIYDPASGAPDFDQARHMRADISIRVPADQFDQALRELRTLAVRIDSESISGQDVTSEYTDLESQLRNLRAAETQLQAIMADAKRTEDVLAVYNELVNIRGQIEMIEGQLKYYRESAAMALITLSLTPDIASQPIDTGGWQAQGVAREALNALVNALQTLAGAAIWLALYVAPLLLLFGLPLWLIVRGPTHYNGTSYSSDHDAADVLHEDLEGRLGQEGEVARAGEGHVDHGQQPARSG